MAVFSNRERRELVARFSRHLNRGQVKYLRAGHLDVVESERRGARFVDRVSGNPLFDGFTSAGCFNVGRGNERVRTALRQALATYDMGTPGCDSPVRAALRRRLAELAPGDLDQVFLVAGGGDAVDMAIKLARAATGRPEVIATDKAYHGHTGFALSANGKPHYRSYCEPLMPGFRFVPFNDLEAMRRQVSASTAAILVEPVQGEAGIYVGRPDYLRGLRKLADDTGALLIFDEIQTGFGRTGRLFAAQHSGVVPDIMTVAKSLGGGLYPNAAVIARTLPAVQNVLERSPEFHRTTGGSDLGCAVSLAVLDEMEEGDLPARAAHIGGLFRAGLLELQKENPNIIKEVRGIGMMLGLEYIHEFMGPMMSDALARQGIFAAYSGNAPQVMRFMLPLTLTEDELDEVLEAVRRAVASMRLLLPLALPAARIPVVRQWLNSEAVQTGLFGALRTVEDLVARKDRRSGGER